VTHGNSDDESSDGIKIRFC